MDEYDAALLRTVELALQNPRPGSPAAAELSTLIETTRRYEARRFPFVTHPRTGVICTCCVLCAGITCRCWCHSNKGQGP